MEVRIESGFRALPEQGILRVRGADALDFLHGQLTNAIKDLECGAARPAAYCMPQGRLLANGVIWRAETEGVDWMVPRDLIPGLVQRLRMFVLRARATIEADDTPRVQGVFGARNIPAPLHDAPVWTHLREDTADWIVAPMTRPGMPAAWRIGPGGDDTPPASDWNALRLADGWPWIRAATRDLFLPGALDLDLNGTIDFRKGCYPGQEVIARSHYRGTVKRRLAYGTTGWPPDAPLDGALDLYPAGLADGRPIGRLIESVIHAGQLHVAAEITATDWPRQRYAVGRPDGPVLDLRLVHPTPQTEAATSPQTS